MRFTLIVSFNLCLIDVAAGQPENAQTPSEAEKLFLNGDRIHCTKGHPFRVSGAGWRMAKLLEPGDRIHALEGVLELVFRECELHE